MAFLVISVWLTSEADSRTAVPSGQATGCSQPGPQVCAFVWDAVMPVMTAHLVGTGCQSLGPEAVWSRL